MVKKVITYIIDLLILLVILVVGIYGYKLLANKSAGIGGGNGKVLLTVEFERQENAHLEKINIGDEIFDSSKNEFLGVVKEMSEISPTVIHTIDYTKNEIVRAENDAYGMRTIVLECSATVTPTAIHVNDTEAKIRTSLGFRSNHYALRGKIMGIEVIE